MFRLWGYKLPDPNLKQAVEHCTNLKVSQLLPRHLLQEKHDDSHNFCLLSFQISVLHYGFTIVEYYSSWPVVQVSLLQNSSQGGNTKIEWKFEQMLTVGVPQLILHFMSGALWTADFQESG